jgi:chlorobactene glucosyltransferase
MEFSSEQLLTVASGGFLALRGIVSLINTFTPIDIDQIKNSARGTTQKISILIPARNEEERLPFVLNDLLTIVESECIHEIIIMDDHSEDNTHTVASRFAAQNPKFKVARSNELPTHWMGKSWVCHQLASLAQAEVLLFIDADIRLSYGLIEKCLSQMEEHDYELLSVFPKQETITMAEKASVPIIARILLQLLPLQLANSTNHPALSAANGQWMMIRKSTYDQLQPHHYVYDQKAEDIEIAKWLRSNRRKTAVFISTSGIRCRMYDSWNDIKHGFAKNIISMMTGSKIFTVMYWLLSLIMPLALLGNNFNVGILFIIASFLINYIISVRSGAKMITSIFYAIPVTIFFFYISLIGIFQTKSSHIIWKGRSI